MPRTYKINGVEYTMTAEEEAVVDAEEKAHWDDAPMADWKHKIQHTDIFGVPRFLEDLITSNPSLVIPPVMKKRYDEKIKIRATKP